MTPHSSFSTPHSKRATYPEYKPSGVEWLGDVPVHWEVFKLKHIASVQFSSVDKHTVEGEEPVRLCNYVDVYYNDFIADTLEFMVATATRGESAKFQIREGDVLVTKDSESWDDIAVPAYVTADLDGVLCGYHLAQIRPSPQQVHGKYLFRAFRARGINDQFRVAATGITRFGLSKYWLDNGQLLVPPLTEQREIAAFLDRETARMDALIEKKQRQIELLQEKRAALISHAVTKGLDPNAKMRDSGIEWLGEVPARWPVVRLGYFARVLNGSTPSRIYTEYWMEGDVPWLSSSKVNEDVITEPSEWVTETARIESGLKIMPAGSVVIGLVGQGRTRGMSALMAIDAAINQNIAAIIPGNRFVGRYLHYLLQHMYEPVREGGRGANQPALNCELIADLRVLLPPLNEQKAIAEHLDRVSEDLSAFSAKIEHSVALLREYRTALISAAVTGKIDVRQEAA